MEEYRNYQPEGSINGNEPQPGFQPQEERQAPPPRPKTWLAQSILVTIFCAVPFGIVGIVFASRVERAYREGRYQEAMEASANAKKWTKIGFFVGLGVIALYLTLFLLGFFSGLDSYNYYY